MFGLTGAGAGSFSLGRPLMCSGANLFYSRDLYLDTRPFDPVDKMASGDDMFMLIGARKLKRKISFNPDPRANGVYMLLWKTQELSSGSASGGVGSRLSTECGHTDSWPGGGPGILWHVVFPALDNSISETLACMAA